MTNEKIIKYQTILFFIGWTVIFLLGADFPPPIGFLWLLVLIAILDFIQYKYLQVLLPRLRSKEKGLFLKNWLFFTLGGTITALVTLLVDQHNPIQMTLVDQIIWICVVTTVASIYGIAFWFINKRLIGHTNRS